MNPLLLDLLAPFIPHAARPWTCGRCCQLNAPSTNWCARCDPDEYNAEVRAMEAAHASH